MASFRPSLVSLVCSLLVVSALGGKVGSLRKRLAQSSSDEMGRPGSNDSPERRVRRGGHRQRRATDLGDDVSTSRGSADPFTKDLRHRWAKGELTSAAVQSLAYSARLQGAQNLDRLSAIGTSGANPQNLFRDLVRVLGMPAGAPPIDWIELPLKGNRKKPHPVIWPHKWFYTLPAGRPDIWKHRVTGPEGAAYQFWESIRESEFVRRHPYLPHNAWDKILPLGLHGDGGGFNKHDSLYTLNWNSLLSSGRTVQTRFFILCCEEVRHGR